MSAVQYSPSSDDSAVKLVRVCIAAIIIQTAFTILRFWSRGTRHGGQIGLDDWFSLAALVFSTAEIADVIVSVHHGFGRHITYISSEESIKLEKLVYVMFVLFHAGVACTKISMTSFYARIFTVNRRLNVGVWIINGLAVGLFLFATCWVFACSSAGHFWDFRISATCGRIRAWYVVSAVWDAILDVVILMMPMPILWHLQMKTTRKWLLTGVFTLGYSTVAVSLARIAWGVGSTQDQSLDIYYHATSEFYWVVIEVPYCIICISLPSIFNLWERSRQGGIKSLFARNPTHLDPYGPDDGRGQQNRAAGFARLRSGAGSGTNVRDVSVQATASQLSSTHLQDIPLGEIRVRTDMDVHADVRV